MLTNAQRAARQVPRAGLHRASASHVRVFLRPAPRAEVTGSDQLKAFGLMRHDRVAAASLRQKRERTAHRANSR
jgi:hypothetical protein